MTDIGLIGYLLSNGLMALTVMQFMRIFFGRPAKNQWRAGFCYAVYILGISAVYLRWQQPALTLLTNILLIFCLAANYPGSWAERAAATAFIYISFLLCESLVAVVLSACDGVWFDRFTEMERLISQLCIPLVTLAFIKCIGRLKILQGHEQMRLKAWVAVLAVPVCTVLPILFIVVRGQLQDAFLIVMCIAELLLINVAVFYLYNLVAQHYQKELEWQRMDQQQKAYQQQAQLFQEKQEEMQNLQHDLQHHIDALQAYCQENHNAEALKYVDNLAETLQWPEEYISTGINALDAIVNYKLLEAKQAKVKVEKSIEVPNRLRFITADDLCAVLGNLLDNALRAVSSLPEPSRRLTLAITYKQDILTITVTNPYSGRLRRQQGRLLTTKTDGGQHGIGLRSVAKIADKYKGVLTLTEDEQMFTAQIWLSDFDWQDV